MIDQLINGYSVFQKIVQKAHKIFPTANGTLKIDSYRLSDKVGYQAEFVFSAKNQFPQTCVEWLSKEEYESLKYYCEWNEHSALFRK